MAIHFKTDPPNLRDIPILKTQQTPTVKHCLLFLHSLFVEMAVSHQSGTIVQHWNDPPTTTFTKNKSAMSSSVSLGIPTPPATPSQDNDGLSRALTSLLSMPTSLAGRNRDMIFTRIRSLIKSVDECQIPGISIDTTNIASQSVVLETILSDVVNGDKSIARERVIKMMSEERGIAAWGTALRIVIENVV
jgi:hypothetical protein